jgi:hypothetical protein
MAAELIPPSMSSDIAGKYQSFLDRVNDYHSGCFHDTFCNVFDLQEKAHSSIPEAVSRLMITEKSQRQIDNLPNAGISPEQIGYRTLDLRLRAIVEAALVCAAVAGHSFLVLQR